MWQYRSTDKELIDLGPSYYSPAEYKSCLDILFRINRLLGFFTKTKKILKKLSPNATVLDVGCGSGMFLLHLNRHFPNMKFIGIDVSYNAIEFAQQKLMNESLSAKSSISFKVVTPDWEMPSNSVDVLMANLLCHHLTDEELVTFFQTSLERVKKAVIIHDLQRSKISYWLYKIISPLFGNRLIYHDGLISIKRGFKSNELIMLLKKAGIKNYRLSWHFPFCWRIILWKN